MNFEVLGDRVIAEPLDVEAVTKTGIILPEQAKRRPQEATVKGVWNSLSNLDEGDVVLYSQYGGTEITIDSKEYIILREADILGRRKTS